jgi:fatty acid desaturase
LTAAGVQSDKTLLTVQRMVVARQPQRPCGPPDLRPGDGVDARPFAELSRQIKDAGLMAPRPGYYTVKILGTAGLFIAGWAAFLLLGRSWWQLATAVLLGVAFTQVAFLGHDAGHKQILRTRRGSYVLGLLHANLAVGLSYGWWIDKHNRHHAHPNEIGSDPDIDTGVLVFIPGERRRHRTTRLATRAQAYFFFPLLLLEGLHLHVAGLLALRERPVRARCWEGAALTAHLIAYTTVVVLVLDRVQAIVFVAVQQGVFGVYMGCSFAPNHKGMPILQPGEEPDFLRRQVVTSRNIRGRRVVDLSASYGLSLRHLHAIRRPTE